MKLIGIDGGGTSTRFSLFDENGNVLQAAREESVHILTQDRDDCIRRLRNGITAVDPASECMVIGGLAGYGQQEEVRREIEEVCRTAFGNRKFHLYSDVDIAVSGALNGEDGIVLIAGTGSIAEAEIDGKMYRCGGWGYQLGDEGSGFWIADKMFHAFVKEADGRMEKTELYSLIMNRLNLVHDYDIITGYMKIREDRARTAEYASLCYEAAMHNDPAARMIFHEAAAELAQLAGALSMHFESNEIKVCCMGGIFEHMKEPLLPELQKLLKPYGCVLQESAHNAEYGAYLLGRRMHE
jgi:N-acetylglucosamine kinase-like BadF-type ATPase